MSSTRQSKRSEAPQEAPEHNKPVFTRRVWTGTGSVEVAVFEKPIEKDGQDYVVYNTVAKRTWKSEKGYEFGNSFRAEDLLVLALFLQEAASYICNEQSKR